MAKKVVIITFFASVGRLHSEHLKKIFGDKIDVKCYSYDTNNIDNNIDADVVVVSLYSIYVAVKKYISPTSKVAIISVTITKKQYEEIMKIPPGRKVMLVNYSGEMTIETITLFHQIGINHIEFIPMYPGVKSIPYTDIAVTPGEPQVVPSFAKEIIDIGCRVLDANTIIDIAMKLNLENMLQEKNAVEHLENLMANRDGIALLLEKATTLESQFLSLLNVMDEGIVVIDIKGIVYMCNKKALEIIGYKENIIGNYIFNIIPQIPFARVLENSQSIDRELINLNGCNISITVVPVVIAGKITSLLAIINRFEENEKKQHHLRSQLLGRGYKARYTFDDIIGNSNFIAEQKKVAKKMALSDSSVLITGESGTGKELFAQAIHNASKRKEYQFVAINCSALPDSLLESELFGYEEGAFTGARKGGKPGLFELAHKGTLFLDEIGEMASNLQARLLRVLQEREMMRVGGDRIIKIDTRIIAATNKDLRSLMENGIFRKDLYYRLNVLPLEVVPLRKRKEDIMHLFDHIKRKIGAKFILSKEAKKIFENYTWDGNVRELMNCVEYFAYLDKNIIESSDLPTYMKKQEESIGLDDIEREKIIEFKHYIGPNYDKFIFVLDCLENSLTNRSRLGRRSIAEISQAKGIFLSEGEIRKVLLVLDDHNLTKSLHGRGGTIITNFGIKALRYLKIGLKDK